MSHVVEGAEPLLKPGKFIADLFAKAQLTSVSRATPQKIARVEHSGIGSHHESADLIGFDPALDFTIQPWLVEKLNRELLPGDVILGAGREAPLGSQLLIFGKPHTVYGRLGKTAVSYTHLTLPTILLV